MIKSLSIIIPFYNEKERIQSSLIEIKNFIVKKASFGIAVKDSSFLNSTEIEFVKNRYFDLMSYIKKPFFSKSSVLLNTVKGGLRPKAICQVGEYMKVNNKTIDCSEINVDDLYSDKKMKKADAN